MQENPKKRKYEAEYNRKPVNKCDSVRLAAIGRRTSEVAHELNNTLDGAMRYVELTMRFLERENLDKSKEYLTNCQKALTRMRRIVRELLEFSRGGYLSDEYAQIEQLIEEVIKSLEHRAVSSNVKVLRKYGLGVPFFVNGNLFQVFCNLIRNALDAMPEGGELVISTRQANHDTITVEFQDSGTGLPEGDSETIFEPFFTTKDRNKGTGLGLAICKDIIESNGGHITAENAPDRGCIFNVYLPAKIQTD